MAKTKFATVTPYVRDEFTSMLMIAMFAQGFREAELTDVLARTRRESEVFKGFL